MKKMLNIIVLSVVSISFTSCARYSARPLCELSITTNKNNIGIAAKAFSAEESKSYLGKNLLKKGIQPVQLYIENNSDQTYVFDPYNVGLTLAAAEDVADKIHSSTLARTAISSAISFLLLPPALMMSDTPGSSEALSLIATGGVLSIPIAQGTSSAIANGKIDRDYAGKGAKVVKIAPHEALNCVIFVYESHYRNHFDVHLKNEQTEQLLTLKTNI